MTLTALLAASLVVVGPFGALPHILRMARAQNASGQSPTGWLVGIYANGATLYVNVVQYKAMLLAVGNLIGGALCITSALLIVALNRKTARETAAAEQAERERVADHGQRHHGAAERHSGEGRQRTGSFRALGHHAGDRSNAERDVRSRALGEPAAALS